ncbi:hypothetical protein SAMN04487896_1939 [Paenibacillus sp. ov031]|uniref:hypothetical protein n=1 Tax=Paenibacillus sp. ov031 TaxID=1761879 RepID=UPI00091604D8|nr:hypothetical protein [Paenibacillus sp. ov031]SHN63141.1 hypothetical protein SAMN04487896_1939 [Paenibacillus sp. ov031]
MHKVNQLSIDPDVLNQNTGIWIGGEIAYVTDWPLNQESQPLLHLFSIDCNTLLQQMHVPSLPPGKYISVFSTYFASEYFLDQVTYTGDELEWKENILAGCTYVSVSSEPLTSVCPIQSIPLCGVGLTEVEIEEQDFPHPYQDILGLSDANGYLLLRTGPATAQAPLDGIFFVQTA